MPGPVPLHVLHLAKYAPPVHGGIETVVAELLAGCARRADQVTPEPLAAGISLQEHPPARRFHDKVCGPIAQTQSPMQRHRRVRDLGVKIGRRKRIT